MYQVAAVYIIQVQCVVHIAEHASPGRKAAAGADPVQRADNIRHGVKVGGVEVVGRLGGILGYFGQ